MRGTLEHMAKVGRPTLYCPEIVERFCAAVATTSASIRTICDQDEEPGQGGRLPLLQPHVPEPRATHAGPAPQLRGGRCVIARTARLRVVIPGDPVPQGRGRAIPTARGIRVPERAKVWKQKAAVYMRMAMGSRRPLSGAVGFELLVVMPCPKKDRRQRTPAQRRWDARHVGDADNFLKAALDAGNGVLYEDDHQVSDVRVRRVIGGQHEQARVEVEVWSLEEGE